MVNAKTIIGIIALSVVVALIAGIAFSQFASAQADATRNGQFQTPQGTLDYGQYPQKGPYGSAQYGGPYGYGHGRGMGMCGHSW
jgi:hypothetical protein